MNLKKFGFSCLLATATLFLLVGCSDLMSDYDVGRNHNFVELSMEEALELLDENFEGILYFGFPGCPWCQATVPLMHEAALDVDVEIFYVSRDRDLRVGDWLEHDAAMAWWLYNNGVPNMRWIDEEGDLVEVEDEEELGYRPNINVPQIVHIRNGEIVDSHRGTFEGAESPEMSDEERATLLARYIEIFSAVGVCPLDEDAPDCE